MKESMIKVIVCALRSRRPANYKIYVGRLWSGFAVVVTFHQTVNLITA